MSRSRKRKKGIHPGVAITLFVIGGGFAVKSILGTGGPQRPSGPEQAFSVEVPGAPAADAGGEAANSQDLLRVHGSFDVKSAVRTAFRMLADPAPAVPAAPTAETAPHSGGWVGEAPPQLRLSVVMLSGPSRRASLGGRIVGIGDTIGDVKVRGIDRGRVVVQWRDRQLTYELGDETAVEFREEQARREAEKQAASARAAEEPAATPPEANPAEPDAPAQNQNQNQIQKPRQKE